MVGGGRGLANVPSVVRRVGLGAFQSVGKEYVCVLVGLGLGAAECKVFSLLFFVFCGFLQFFQTHNLRNRAVFIET